MLVLSRKVNQVIKIGSEITLTITDVRGDRCRIGIDAPKDIPVYRQEVFDAIQSEQSGGE